VVCRDAIINTSTVLISVLLIIYDFQVVGGGGGHGPTEPMDMEIYKTDYFQKDPYITSDS
jgi:hypothetical protein